MKSPIIKTYSQGKLKMNVLVLGAGMMGRAVAFDLSTYSHFNHIILADKDTQTLQLGEEFLANKKSPWTVRLEKAFAERFGTRYAIAHNSGTSALHSCLAAAGVGPGDTLRDAGLPLRPQPRRSRSPR